MDLAKVANIIFQKCLGLSSKESCLILCDNGTTKLGRSLLKEAFLISSNSYLLEMKPREINGEELPGLVAETMKYADVVVAPTSKSMTHTKARREACANGARIASMPGITEEILLRTFSVDFDAMYESTMKLTQILNNAKMIEMKCNKGSHLTLSIANRKAIADTGILTEPGMFGNLPAGESYIAPVEGTAQGQIVLDGMMAGVGLLEEPIIIEVVNGLACRIFGGKKAKQLEQLLERAGEKGVRNIAEFGIGTNPSAKVTGKVLEDEKVSGTIHIALGNNISMGGNVDVPIHLDGVVMKPTVYIDGLQIIYDGRLLV
ncbi:MAG: aminopeptidase [Bacillota bacterium]